MTRVLAVADEVEPSLHSRNLMRHEVDLVLACGDLPFDYLEFLVTMLNVPLGFVPGNHDPDLCPPGGIDSADFTRPFGWHWDDRANKGPQGCVNLDGGVRVLAGVRVRRPGRLDPVQPRAQPVHRAPDAGPGPAASVAGHEAASEGPRSRGHRHHPRAPGDVGDGEDPAHRGFATFHTLVSKMQPRFLLHGHVHPYGKHMVDGKIEDTRVMNVVGHKLLEI